MAFYDTLKNASASFARMILPQSIEERIGLTPPVTKSGGLEFKIKDEKAKEVAMGIKPEEKKSEFEILKNNNTLKDDVKNVIKRDIQSGVFDKETIKQNAKNFLTQKVNEKIIAKKYEEQSLWTWENVKKEPVKYLDEVFDRDIPRNVKEIVQGLGTILAMAGKRGFEKFKSPIKTTEQEIQFTKNIISSPAYREKIFNTYIKPITEEYKEYRHPFQKLADDPVDVALDAEVLFSLGIGGAAKVATKLGAKETAETLSKFKYPLSIKSINNTTKAIVKKMPGGEEMIKNLEIRSATRKMLRKEQTSFINLRNKIINNIDEKVNKLSKSEAELLPQVAEGFVKVPTEASKEFHEALGMMDALARDQERFGLEIGKLTPEIVERRKYQPLAKFIEKEKPFEVVRKAKIPLKFDEEAKLITQIPYEQLTGDELRGAINVVKKWFPEADPIYMRHFFEDKPKNFSNFFLNTKPAKEFKPGFLKKSYGVEGYIGQTGEITKPQLMGILERQASENLKWQQNIKLIDNLKEHPLVKPLKKGEKPMEGYKIFAPDGMLRFYRGTIDLADELKKKIDIKTDVWDAFEDAVNAAFPDNKTYIGVTKAKLYQAPTAMADELTKLVKSTNPWMKLIYDKPLDAARFSMLAIMPRWLVNNVIGNAIFSIVSGDVFNPKAFYQYFQAKKAGLFPDDLFGGIHRTERTTSGRIGTAAELPLVKSSIAMHDALLNTKVVGQILRGIEGTVNWGIYKPIKKIGNLSFKNNQAVDDLFKGVSYINKALKEDRKGLLGRMVANWDDTRLALEKVGKDTVKMDKIIDNVHEWYYHGLNLTDFERRTLRRVIPFYSWMRWSTLYAYRIASEAPVRANIIKNMSRDFYTFTGQDKLPEWLKGSVPIGNDEDGTVYYLKTSGANPFGHLNDLMDGGIVSTVGQASAPALKTYEEQRSGEEVFLGKKFTKEGVYESFNGSLYRFDPETGKVVEVPEAIKPGIIENLLRNYFPQYLLMEVALTGGRQRYTAEGLDTILSDLFKDESERKSIVKDIITKQGIEKKKFWNEVGKAVGVNIQEIKPGQEKKRQEALEAATSAIKNKELPILNPRFKEMIKERMIQEIVEGTPKNEISDKVKEWVGVNIEELKKLK